MSVRYECVEVSKALVVYCYEADERNTILYLYLIIWIFSFTFYLFCCLLRGFQHTCKSFHITPATILIRKQRYSTCF